MKYFNISLIFLSKLIFLVNCFGNYNDWSSKSGNGQLNEKFSWKKLDWEFPSEYVKNKAISSGNYQPQNGLPVGIEVWRNKLFVTVPRWKKGIPATLNWINLDQHKSGSPKLTPYPSLQQNTAGDCGNGLTTAYRIHADQCNRLWVLDTGTIGDASDTVQVCPYTLKIFDLSSDKIIRQYVFKPNDTNQNTFIANIAVDLGHGGCNDAYAYMSDELGYGLIVYSWAENTSWRVHHGYFLPDPLKGDWTIAGLNFQWEDEGIFGMSLSPITSNGFRTLYFHPLSSFHEFSVSTEILRNKTLALNSYHAFKVVGERKKGHSTAETMDNSGIQLFNLVDQNAVGCWNSKLPYTPENHGIIAKDDKRMIFPADVKVKNGIVWIVQDKMPGFMITGVNFNEINFRIFTIPFAEAIAGTVCDNFS